MTGQELDALYITKALRKAGASNCGIAGVLGNFDAESNIVPCRMQGDFTAGYAKSLQYAKAGATAVDIESWAKDQIGFGLAQWTYWTRKFELLSYARSSGQFVGDVKPQVEFFLTEVQRDYPGVWAVLCSENSTVRKCSDAMLLNYERPADMSESAQVARWNLSVKWFNFVRDLGDIETPSETEAPKNEDMSTTDGTSGNECWPPRMLCKGMLGKDVMLLQALLNCRDYGCAADGIFGEGLDKKVRQFQSEQGLSADGICGPITWEALKKW